MKGKIIIATLAFLAAGLTPTLAQNEPMPCVMPARGGQAQRPQLQRGRNENCCIAPEQRIEQKAQRMANALMLDDKVTAQFIPLYKKYLEELNNCCRPQNSKQPAACPAAGGCCAIDELTDEQIEQCMEQCFERRQQRLDIQKKYYAELSKMLTPKQLMKVFGGKRHCGFGDRLGFRHHPQRGCAPAMRLRNGQGWQTCNGACPLNNAESTTGQQ